MNETTKEKKKIEQQTGKQRGVGIRNMMNNECCLNDEREL